MALTYNHFPRLRANLPALLDLAVRSSAFEIEAGARKNAPHRTGFLAASIYTITSKGIEHYTAMVTATARVNKKIVKNGGIERELFPQAQITTQDGCEAWVYVGAIYGLPVEMGTHRSAPTFFMTRAARTVAPTYYAKIGRAFKLAAGA